MNYQDLSNTVNQLASTIGKGAVHALYPDDFEYYMCTLELLDSDNNLVDCLVFPVNPDSMSETELNNSQITKTAGGITINSDFTFQPISLKISGSFGKRFKFLLGRDVVFNGHALSLNGKVFNNQIKTGYGVTKVLKNILSLSRLPDSKGNPHKLFFHNSCFGTSYLVKYISSEYNQSLSTNMYWTYSIALTAVAPMNNFTLNKNNTLIKVVSKGVLSQGIDELSKNLRQLTKNAI